MASKKTTKRAAPDIKGLLAFFPDLERVRSLSFEELLQEKTSIAAEIDRRLQLKIQEHGPDALTRAERAVYVVSASLFGEVRNGGFHQYLYNSSGDTASEVIDALRLLSAPSAMVDLVSEALSALPSVPNRNRAKRQKQVDALGDAARQRWRKLEDDFFKLSDAFVEEFVRRHPKEFTLG